MKHKILFLLIFLMPFPHSVSLFSQDIPEDSLYLGQIPPDDTPKIFNLPVIPGFFAAERIAISNDGKNIYFNELNGYSSTSQSWIKYLSYDSNKWIGPFNLFEGYGAPGLSITGDTIFIQNTVAYFSVKNDTSWSKPARFLISPAHYLQVTNNRNYYMSSNNVVKGIGGYDISKLIINSSDTIIQSLGLPINTSGDDFDFYIAKDESFIIFSSRGPGRSPTGNIVDLFISYRKNDNTWTNPKDLGPIINNTSANTWSPYVTTNKRFLFYYYYYDDNSKNFIHWVKIDNVIDSLKHTNFIPYLKTSIPDQTDTVSHSYSFTIPDSTFIDDDGNNTLTYSPTMPSWLDFDPGTMTISGTPDTAGTFTIKITATDTADVSASISFSLIIIDNHPTSINRIDEQNVFIYPNPTTGLINISFGTKLVQMAIIEIYDLQGKLVFSETFHNSATAAINIANLPEGMYIISISNNTATYNEIICKK